MLKCEQLFPCRVPARRNDSLATIYVITPTYYRHTQMAELLRLSYTLLLVPNVHWIIVEDANIKTGRVTNLISRLEEVHKFRTITQLHARTPPEFKLKAGEPSWARPKGLWQRNAAIEWLRKSSSSIDSNGVVYFADDDNTYDLRVFEEMRNTLRVSIWPVALAGGLLVERPIVDDSAHGGKVVAFNSLWQPARPYPIDMAGFAVSVRHLLERTNAKFTPTKIGYMESLFLQQLISSWDELEPKADRCTKVYVWHTQTKSPQLHEERKLAKPSFSDLEW